jgi:hypothetical protein
MPDVDARQDGCEQINKKKYSSLFYILCKITYVVSTSNNNILIKQKSMRSSKPQAKSIAKVISIVYIKKRPATYPRHSKHTP